MRIVSLLPSATEIICSLDLQHDLVGVTHECDYPPPVATLPKVTRTLVPHDASSHEIDRLVRQRLQAQKALYTLDMETLADLRPDLIVTQALCDVCAVAEAEVQEAACHLPGTPRVLNLEPMSLSDVFDSLLRVGEATGRDVLATEVNAHLKARVERVAERTRRAVHERARVVHLEWIDPPFNAGHWTPELIELAGGSDCIGNRGKPSCTISWQMVLDAQPDVLFVALCGCNIERSLKDIPILEAQPGWSELPCVRQSRIYVADGHQYFNRPGPRLVDSLEMLAHALYPQVHPIPDGVPAAQRITV
ncbi:MAG: cobalamin-binding protein [Gammaproteobacteria bacterium]